MGLGPGGQPISATQLSMGGGMGSMGPGGKSVFFIFTFYRALSLELPFLCVWKNDILLTKQALCSVLLSC